MNEVKMYGVLCESDEGLDFFGNPMGYPMLMESIGKMTYSSAIKRCDEITKSGRYGKCLVVKLMPVNFPF